MIKFEVCGHVVRSVVSVFSTILFSNESQSYSSTCDQFRKSYLVTRFFTFTGPTSGGKYELFM